MPDSPAQGFDGVEGVDGADGADASDAADGTDSTEDAAALRLSCIGSGGMAPPSAPSVADARAGPELDVLARELGETDFAFVASSLADRRDHAACTVLRLERVVFFEGRPIARFHSIWQRRAAGVRRAAHGAPPACCGARSA